MSKRAIILFVVTALCGILSFSGLGKLPLQVWDESRQAVSAVEMLHSGQWFVTTYEGKPDGWNLKPPLLVWCQVVSMKAFGVNEFAVRFPAALAGLFTCLLVWALAARFLQDGFVTGALATLVLATTPGYVGIHAARTGDYDALFVFFSLLYVYAFARWQQRGYRWPPVFGSALALSLAILTKNVAGLFCLPVLAVCLLYFRNPGGKWKTIALQLFTGFVICSGIVGGYYGLREQLQPGYLSLIYNEELLTYSHLIPNHQGPPWYYLELIFTQHMTYWVILLTALFLLFQFKPLAWQPRPIVLLLIGEILFLLILLSGSKMKTEWYDVPVYPFLSLIVAIYLYYGFNFIRERFNLNSSISYLIAYAIFIYPVSNMFMTNAYPSPNVWRQQNYRLLMQQFRQAHPNVKAFTIFNDDYNSALLFYAEKYALEGLKITLAKSHEFAKKGQPKITPENYVLTAEPSIQQYMTDSLGFHTTATYTGGYELKLK